MTVVQYIGDGKFGIVEESVGDGVTGDVEDISHICATIKFIGIDTPGAMRQ